MLKGAAWRPRPVEPGRYPIDALRLPQVRQIEIVASEQAWPLHRVQGKLVAVEHDQPPRTQLGDLPSQLPTDGPAGAGD